MAGRVESLVLPPSGPTMVPHQIPSPQRSFVNRTDELARLRSLARTHGAERSPGLVLLTGLGGVGKTQLVSQWVDDAVDRLYPGGQLYVDLEALRRDGAVDMAAVLEAFLRSLGVHKDFIPAGLQQRSALFRSITAVRKVVVVADSVRQAPEARCLLPGQGLLVATSRTDLPSLAIDGAVRIKIDPLDQHTGVQLVCSWEPAAGKDTAAELVRLCGGLPLALRTAGEWLASRPHLGLDQVVRILAANGPLHPAEGSPSVNTILDTVYENFPAHTKQLYSLLGCLPGTSATQGVAAAAGVVRFDDALGDLFTAHLTVPVQSPDRTRRFRLHDAVRGHARRVAQTLPEDVYVRYRRAVVDYYAAATAHADVLVLGASRMRLQGPPRGSVEELSPAEEPFTDGPEALEWLDAEQANLLSVLRLAAEHQWYGTVWRLCESLWALYHSRTLHADSIEAHRLGIEAAQWEGRRDAEVRMRNQLARTHYALGDHAQAEQELAAAEALFGLIDDPRLSGVVRESQGLIALATGHHDKALALFSQAYDANVQMGDQHGAIVQGYNIGQALTALGHWERALDTLTEALATARATHDDAMCPRIGIVQARALQGLGRLEEALDAAVAAAERASALKLYVKLGQALALLADLSEQVDDPGLRAACRRRLRELRTTTTGVLPRIT
ncbi:tetratricopeptide repeat protein [Streptomyces sp. SID14478]|nr:tetratricopeptide repeat protein [Streptomyces sp. SID14478]NEB80012.1 tetratricopeptide repeat protein [Streptomyces sp. SID14478]